MTLTYIFHSGYLIETGQCALVFDYYQDSEGDRKGVLHRFLSACRKPVYVFASHFHPDHFSRIVLSWKEQYPEVAFHYIFSDDIRRRRKVPIEAAHFLRRGETYEDALIEVKAFGSTDAGVSFSVKTDGKTLFHAGDLNNWHWKDESTPQEIAHSEQAYARELDYLAQSHDHFDTVMFPVDPRQGTDYAKGAAQFLDRFPTALFCPMHFGEAYYVSDELRPLAPAACRVISWQQKGEQIVL